MEAPFIYVKLLPFRRLGLRSGLLVDGNSEEDQAGQDGGHY